MTKHRAISGIPVICIASLQVFAGRSFPAVSAFTAHQAAARTRMQLKTQQVRLLATNNDDTIITPRDPDTLFNFGPASTRDQHLFTCERPGGEVEGQKIGPDTVAEWADFMREKGVDQVLVLIDDNELEAYEEPGLVKMYESEGFKVHRNPMGDIGASTRAMDIVSKCADKGTKIVAHCTHGQGRAGRVAAAWLTHKYDLSPQEATTEALDTATKHGVTRLGSASKLASWLANI